jgi:cytochrome c551
MKGNKFTCGPLSYMLVLVLIVAIMAVILSCKSSEELKKEQYLVNGEKIYLEKCANCHGKKGEGLERLYPPLAQADFLLDFNASFCIIKNGRREPIIVNGKTYTQPMPKITGLYDLDYAQLSTFLLHKFAQKDTLVSVEDVKAVSCQK